MSKELIWKVTFDELIRKYYITNADSTKIIAKDGKIYMAAEVTSKWVDDVYFMLESRANDFIKWLCDNTPDIMYYNKAEPFVSTEIANEIITSYMDSFVANIVDALMDNEITFTRHDVLKTIRQLVGPNVIMEYSDWKDVIIEILDDKIEEYGYKVEYTINGHFVYSLAPEIEDEDDEEEEDTPTTVTKDSANPSTIITAAPDPKRVENRHTFTAKQVRKCGGFPGATMHIVICKGRFFISAEIKDNVSDWLAAGRPSIIMNARRKVDKNCNLRLSKYMFDLAEIGHLFRKDLDPYFKY